ncbi:MAG: cohesin domain-containing protein [Thermodesulfobacteriota bacterium]
MRKRTVIIGLFQLVLCLPFILSCQNVANKSKKDKVLKPEIKEYTISINSAPNPVRAFLFDVLFDHRVYKFNKFVRTGFTVDGFKLFDMNEFEPGRLRIGGVSTGPPPIGKGASGDIVVLYFEVTAKGPPKFEITELEDHFKGWGAKHLTIKIKN